MHNLDRHVGPRTGLLAMTSVMHSHGLRPLKTARNPKEASGDQPTANRVTVLLNAGVADRTGRQLYRRVPVDNTSSAAYARIVTVAGIPGGTDGVDVVSIQAGRSFAALGRNENGIEQAGV